MKRTLATLLTVALAGMMILAAFSGAAAAHADDGADQQQNVNQQNANSQSMNFVAGDGGDSVFDDGGDGGDVNIGTGGGPGDTNITQSSEQTNTNTQWTETSETNIFALFG